MQKIIQKMNTHLDQKDKEILNLIIQNSKLSFRQIAKKINSSAATVMNRIKRLRKSNIIKDYHISIDYEKIGYDFPVIIEIQVSHGKLKQVEEKIAKSPNIFAVYDTTGQFDVTVLGRFKTRREMDNYIKKCQHPAIFF